MAEHKTLYEKCQLGDIEEVKKLLVSGGDPKKNLGSFGSTAFHVAALRGHQMIVALLLDQHGVDPNIKCYLGVTALHIAVGNNDQGIVALSPWTLPH